MWSQSLPVTSNTPPFNYLRQVRKYEDPIPLTLRYLPPRRPEHHHAMIAAIGAAGEPEPGSYLILDDAVAGVHLTLLRQDGAGKAAVEQPKITVGRGTVGLPICLTPPNDLLALVITEGIEDALSIHQATQVGAWAAGCANRLPALAERVPAWIESVVIVAHPDRAGQEGAVGLAEALLARGIATTLLQGGQ